MTNIVYSTLVKKSTESHDLKKTTPIQREPSVTKPIHLYCSVKS